MMHSSCCAASSRDQLLKDPRSILVRERRNLKENLGDSFNGRVSVVGVTVGVNG